MSSWRTAALAAVAVFVPWAARAWDPSGHMIVDQIAWETMTPAVRAKAAELIKPLDAQFNGGQPYNFVTAGSWMDDMRGLGRDYKWSKLHYIDIPWTPGGSGDMRMPSPPHVLSGIDDCLKTLRDPAATGPQRTEALGMLVHFVGDVHQPLHATERGQDRGGNTYLISGVPFSDLAPKQLQNLHTFWDKAFRFDGANEKVVETWMGPSVKDRPTAPGQGIIAEKAKEIMATYPRASLPELNAAVEPMKWALESHLLGCAKAYPPGDPPADTEVRPVTPEFVHESAEIARKRLALAGYRLGALLNDLLSK